MAWPPAVIVYVLVVAVVGVIVPLLRDDCRSAAGEQLGERAEGALVDLAASGGDLDAWQRLWTALPVRRAAL